MQWCQNVSSRTESRTVWKRAVPVWAGCASPRGKSALGRSIKKKNLCLWLKPNRLVWKILLWPQCFAKWQGLLFWNYHLGAHALHLIGSHYTTHELSRAEDESGPSASGLFPKPESCDTRLWPAEGFILPGQGAARRGSDRGTGCRWKAAPTTCHPKARACKHLRRGNTVSVEKQTNTKWVWNKQNK